MTEADTVDPFLAGLRGRLGDVVSSGELLVASDPPGAARIERRVTASSVRIGGRLLRTLVPRVVLTPADPLDARALCAAWGVARPIAVSGDVHQASWHLAERGADLPDARGTRIEALRILAGRWSLVATLDHRPEGPLPRLVAGASPAYELLQASEATITSIEAAASWHPVDLVAGTHPDTLRLTAGRRAAYPRWGAGWDLNADARFLVVYDGDRPAAGAAIRHGPDGTSVASRLCEAAGPDAAVGSDLLDALEAVAAEAGSTRLRLDASAFLADEAIPWQRHGYVVGPPYDGDADVETWAERTLTPIG